MPRRVFKKLYRDLKIFVNTKISWFTMPLCVSFSSLVFLLAMDIDKILQQWLTDRWETMKNYQADCLESLKDCQAMRRYRQAEEFSHSHPVIAIFLAFVFGLGFFPVIVFVSFVFGSFVFIFLTALTVFAGVLVVSLVPFLAVVVPILMLGGVLAVFVYIAHCCVVKIRRIITPFNRLAQSKLPSRINGKRIRFAGHRVKPHAPQLEQEEALVDELFNRSLDCL